MSRDAAHGGSATPRRVSSVLICDRRGRELAARVSARRPDLQCRVRPDATLTAADRIWADALIGFAAPGPLDGSSIRWVHSTGAGVDGLLLGHRWPDDVTLTRTVGALGDRMAQYCVGHALAHTQRVLPFHRDQIARRWSPVEPTTLRGARVVIVGTGSVGSVVAARFGGFGCETIGVSRRGRSTPGFDQVRSVDQLGAMVETARWLVLAAPLTPATRGLMDGPVLSRCRGGFLINVSRGALLDTSALLAALDAGRLAGAALDVFDEEPLPSDSPLWEAPGVRITPHIAGVTHVDEAADAFLEALTRLEAGERPHSAVDPTRGY